MAQISQVIRSRDGKLCGIALTYSGNSRARARKGTPHLLQARCEILSRSTSRRYRRLGAPIGLFGLTTLAELREPLPFLGLLDRMVDEAGDVSVIRFVLEDDVVVGDRLRGILGRHLQLLAGGSLGTHGDFGIGIR